MIHQNLHPSEITEEQIFEGPEKNLQIIFTKSCNTLLLISRDVWERMLSRINCSIISCMENTKCKSFILSESSLFVFYDRVILKTCGTIPLLYSLPLIIEIGESLGLKTAAVLYWRKNFSYPEKQPYPHGSFYSEKEFLDKHLKTSKSTSLKCGSSSHDHWYFYYAELENKLNFRPVSSTFELKMHEIHSEISKSFFFNFKKTGNPILHETRNLLPNMSIDEYFFDPCGYSMNALFQETEQYETIHITPENQCSYVSFESSLNLLENNDTFHKCISLFKPLSFTGIEISSSPRVLSNIHQNDYIEAYPISMYLMNGLYIKFFSYIMRDNVNHPLKTVHKLRTRYIIKNSFEDEHGIHLPNIVEMKAKSL